MTEYNQTYYHIQTLGSDKDVWRKGDVISTSSKEFNAFYSGLLRDLEVKENLDNKQVGLIEYSNSIFKKDPNRNIKSNQKDYESLYFEYQSNSFEYESLANKLQLTLFQYLKWIREELFEKVRIKTNPNLPSRKHCIWISNKGNLEKWWNIFKNKSGKRILEIRLKNNNIFIADGTLIKTETYGLSDYENIAERYWLGKIESDDELEISYEGEFEILNEYNDIKEIQ